MIVIITSEIYICVQEATYFSKSSKHINPLNPTVVESCKYYTSILIKLMKNL